MLIQHTHRQTYNEISEIKEYCIRMIQQTPDLKLIQNVRQGLKFNVQRLSLANLTEIFVSCKNKIRHLVQTFNRSAKKYAFYVI